MITTMRAATWNLNNRIGRMPFRPEAASAAVALKVDLVVFTEYFPRQHHKEFCKVLAEAGLVHHLLSPEPREIANRVLIASREPLEQDCLALPDFDNQFPVNILAAHSLRLGLRILGLRIPAYKTEQKAQLLAAWDWLEAAAAQLRNVPALILGDLNMPTSPSRRIGGDHFRGILATGWQPAIPATGHSFFGYSGQRSAIDHILATPYCTIRDAAYVTSVTGFTLAGTMEGLSDHAALVSHVEINPAQN